MPIDDQTAVYEQKSVADNPIYQAILASPQYKLEPGQKRVYFSDWLTNQDEVFRDGKFLCADGSEAKLVIIFAGVGAGKTRLATSVLQTYGKVLFNCSRNMIKQQQEQEKKAEKQKREKIMLMRDKEEHMDSNLMNNVVSNDQILFTTSWGLINPFVFYEASQCKYIVVDETHHLFSDTFCDAPNYLDELLNACTNGQTIILMTACAEFLTKAFRFGYKLPQSPVCVIDVRSVCYNLQPNEIKIVTRKTAEDLLMVSKPLTKRLYFCETAKRAYIYAMKMRENGNKAVAVTSSPHLIKPLVDRRVSNMVRAETKRKSKNGVANKYPSIEKTHNIYDQSLTISQMKMLQNNAYDALTNGDFPKDVDVLFATSKLREGINIKLDGYQKVVFTESINQVDLIQICGRFRNPHDKMNDPNIDTYYIVVGNIMKNQEIIERSILEAGFEDDLMRIGDGITGERDAVAKRYTEVLSDDLSNAVIDYYQSLDYADSWLISKNVAEYERFKEFSRNYRIHAAVIKKVSRKIDFLSEKPGLFWCKMNRINLYDIGSYTVERSILWEIHNMIIMDDHRQWNHTNILQEPHVLPLIEYLEKTFSGVPVTLSDPQSDLDTVIRIIDKYKGLLLNQNKWQELQRELIACSFISESKHMWKAISELGRYVIRPRNRKRQEYLIEDTPLIENKIQICSPFADKLKTFGSGPISVTDLSSMQFESFDIIIVNLQEKGFWQYNKYANRLIALDNIFKNIYDELKRECKSKILIILPKNYVIRSESKNCRQVMLFEKIIGLENNLRKLKQDLKLEQIVKPKEITLGKYKYTADFHITLPDGTDVTSHELSEVTSLAVAKNCWLTTLNVLRDVAYLKNYLEYVANLKNEIVLDSKIVVDSEVDVVGQTNDQIIDVEELSDDA